MSLSVPAPIHNTAEELIACNARKIINHQTLVANMHKNADITNVEVDAKFTFLLVSLKSEYDAQNNG